MVPNQCPPDPSCLRQIDGLRHEWNTSQAISTACKTTHYLLWRPFRVLYPRYLHEQMLRAHRHVYFHLVAGHWLAHRNIAIGALMLSCSHSYSTDNYIQVWQRLWHSELEREHYSVLTISIQQKKTYIDHGSLPWVTYLDIEEGGQVRENSIHWTVWYDES